MTEKTKKCNVIGLSEVSHMLPFLRLLFWGSIPLILLIVASPVVRDQQI